MEFLAVMDLFMTETAEMADVILPAVSSVEMLNLAYNYGLTGGLPERRALVAVQPGKVDWGLSLSPAVESAVASAAAQARAILERW